MIQVWLIFLFFTGVYLFLNPSWIAFLSYCHRRLNNKWLESIWTTSHKTSLECFLKKMKTCFVTFTSPYLFNHWSLYDLWCLIMFRFNFLTSVVIAILAQLLLSIIILHTLLLIWHLVKNIFFFCCSTSLMICP
jgi:hypothetical protein